jgi:hypothetical protein
MIKQLLARTINHFVCCSVLTVIKHPTHQLNKKLTKFINHMATFAQDYPEIARII